MDDPKRKAADDLRRRLDDPDYRLAYADSFLDSAIALQIAALRQARGWTQAELARRAGTHQSRISYLEQVDTPKTLAALRRLMAAFDLPLVLRFEGWEELVVEAASLDRARLEGPAVDVTSRATASPVVAAAVADRASRRAPSPVPRSAPAAARRGRDGGGRRASGRRR